MGEQHVTAAIAGPGRGGPIGGFEIRAYGYPRDRTIGDAFVRVNTTDFGALVLHDGAGESGLGFFYSLGGPLPSEAALSAHFEQVWMPRLRGRAPEGLLHRVDPIRGLGRPTAYALDEAVAIALWDLAAKRAGLPLYRFLGGTEPSAPAYASGLCFHLSESELAAFYGRAAGLGFKAAKVKVGHADVGWELARLSIVAEALGPGAILMVDANEAWTVKETLRRLDAYEAAGHAIFWVEDPIPRDDFEGLRALRRDLRAHVNAGEYLTGVQKRALVEAGACDIVNVHNDVAESLRIAWLAESKGLQVGLGNTMMDFGAHIAAALPNAVYVEHAFLNENEALVRPYAITEGRYRLTEAPGHGLELDPAKDDRRRRSDP